MISIKHWPLAERPREKLLAHGAKHLNDIELLAIFLNTGAKGKSALDLAHELLKETGTLKKLLQIPPDYFYQKPGIGKAKYALLKAALELGRRYLEETIPLGEKLNNSPQTKQFILSRLHDYSHEVFACLFLDNRHRVIAFEELFRGTLNETSVYPREIAKRALIHNAAKIILAHNHPSGDPTPSAADQEMTQLLRQTLAVMDIKVIDHIIIGNQTCISLAELGYL
jgi:DNA repair protein RadC